MTILKPHKSNTVLGAMIKDSLIVEVGTIKFSNKCQRILIREAPLYKVWLNNRDCWTNWSSIIILDCRALFTYLPWWVLIISFWYLTLALIKIRGAAGSVRASQLFGDDKEWFQFQLRIPLHCEKWDFWEVIAFACESYCWNQHERSLSLGKKLQNLRVLHMDEGSFV